MIWIVILSAIVAFSLLTKDKEEWNILDKKYKKDNR